MNVADLIEKLKQFPQDAEVFKEYDGQLYDPDPWLTKPGQAFDFESLETPSVII